IYSLFPLPYSLVVSRIRIHDPHARFALHEAIERAEDRGGVRTAPGNDTGREFRPLVRILVGGLRDRDEELVVHAVLDALQHGPLFFQGATPVQVQLPDRQPNDHSRRALLTDPGERSGDLFDPVALDHVANLDVVEVGNVQAALEALADLADIVLEALETAELPLVHLDAVADDANLPTPLDLAVGDHAPSNGTHPGHLEDLPDFGGSEKHFPLFRREQALHRSLNFRHGLVDDVVEADVDLLPLRRHASFARRPNVEADDDGAGSRGEQHVRLVDRADSPVDDFDPYLGRRELL